MTTIKYRQLYYQKPSYDTNRIRPFLIAVLLLFLLPANLFAQQKHALLIGISDYPQYKDSDASWSRIHGEKTYENRFRAKSIFLQSKITSHYAC